MKNRRNYYRVLHVQPDAPAAVIKATYRTIMQKLKIHPDLGGDTWNAALVNEAYAVLSDSKQREQYDRTVLPKSRQRQPQREVVDDVPEPNPKRGHCLFCKAIFMIKPGRTMSDACLECHSPLQPVDSDEGQIAVRRIAARIEESFDITYYTGWPQLPHGAIAKDFSPTGMAIVGKDCFSIGQLIKIESALLSAVAQVKNQERIRASSPPVRVGLKFITVSFNLPRGTFVAVTV